MLGTGDGVDNDVHYYYTTSIVNYGFSPIAGIYALILIGLMVFTIIGLGLIKLSPGSPALAGNSTASITAACYW